MNNEKNFLSTFAFLINYMHLYYLFVKVFKVHKEETKNNKHGHEIGYTKNQKIN